MRFLASRIGSLPSPRAGGGISEPSTTTLRSVGRSSDHWASAHRNLRAAPSAQNLAAESSPSVASLLLGRPAFVDRNHPDFERLDAQHTKHSQRETEVVARAPQALSEALLGHAFEAKFLQVQGEFPHRGSAEVNVLLHQSAPSLVPRIGWLPRRCCRLSVRRNLPSAHARFLTVESAFCGPFGLCAGQIARQWANWHFSKNHGALRNMTAR